jgi:hypothetical protein
MNPVDIVQAQRDYFVCAQPKPSEQYQHGVVAQAVRGAVLIDYQHLLDFQGAQTSRKRGMGPLWRRWGSSL